jgi:hypothetical protein
LVRLEAIACVALVVVACGSETRSPSSSSSSSGIGGGRGCTELGCENGVDVDFVFRDRGSYVFEVTIDGTKTTCRATLPLPKEFFEACDRPEVFLGLVGSQLPAEQQSIEGLKMPAATNATSITISATRDAVPIGSKTFTPAYDVRPGPNGPDCEPKECKLAKATFP